MLAALGTVVQKPIATQNSCFYEEFHVFLWSMLTNFWKLGNMEDWSVWLCYFSNVTRPHGTKHCRDVCRIAESAVSLLSEAGNKSRVVLILHVIVCTPLPESLYWPSKSLWDRL